jgi:putative transposase
MYNSLSHSKWDCKYHLVFIPKRRKKLLYAELRKQLKEIFHELAKQKGCMIIEGHLMPDHVHMCIQIPPKYAVSSVIGFLKGKSAIAIARFNGKSRNFIGENFWARGYAVSTVGYEVDAVRKYIREQEDADEFGRF